MELNEIWSGKRVLVTGHTGFKGAWLSLWLHELGAEVAGIGLRESPCLIEEFQLDSLASHIVDIRDAAAVQQRVTKIEPEVVFHLAAQSLVRRSYVEAVSTWQTNVMGTLNLLEALRTLNHSVTVVLVTTDKVYENKEWEHGYRETDPLGGHDPYSASKAAMEIAAHSWRESFFNDGTEIAVATARAGNVLGGGDWASDRIFPDIVRSLVKNEPILVRNPAATRPWQHVLEPLAGYLELAARIHRAQQMKDHRTLKILCSAWNLGPLPDSNRTVRDLVENTLQHWPGTWVNRSESGAPHEARFLALAIDKATRYLSWQPRLGFETTVEMCVDWYRRVAAGESARSVTAEQIDQYQCCLKS